MISKNDLIILLTDLQKSGVDVNGYIKTTALSKDIPLSVIKFINNNRALPVANFYEFLRKKNNDKKSDLYKNIVKEVDDPNKALSTLAAFALQIVLFSNKLEDKDKIMFYKHVRAEEVTRVMNNYYKTLDLTEVLKILRLIKIDLKTLEMTTKE